mgnify:CR=1 FL=1
MAEEKQPLLEVNGLKQYFKINNNFTVRAVDGVTFDIKPGETYGLVGESGSGKSTFGQCLMGLTETDDGTIRVDGGDVTHATADQVRDMRRRFQIIYQDPFASLSPRMNIRDIICEPLDIHRVGTQKERTARAAELIEIVGLRAEHLLRFPHEFSGGQRQRISIARALVLNPEFILADEAVSALDVSLQAQIINLLVEMQRQFSLTMLFITHDLSVVEYLCDRVAVLYMGRVVEVGRTKDLCSNPAHPYSQVLLSAIPNIDPRRKKKRLFMRGERLCQTLSAGQAGVRGDHSEGAGAAGECRPQSLLPFCVNLETCVMK